MALGLGKIQGSKIRPDRRRNVRVLCVNGLKLLKSKVGRHSNSGQDILLFYPIANTTMCQLVVSS
jgi:hypothetical protein